MKFQTAFCAAVFVGALAFSAQAQSRKFITDPEAIALLDKTAALYGRAQSLDLEIKRTDFRDRNFAATLRFRRPNALEITRRRGAQTAQVTARNAQERAVLLRQFANPLGEMLGDWLAGRHFLREKIPAGLAWWEAGYLPPRSRPFSSDIMGDEVVGGIRVRAWYEKARPDSVFFWEHVLWFRPENGQLVRIQSRTIGTRFRREVEFNVTNQRFDTP